VVLFRKKVQKEKALLGIFDNECASPSSPSTLITVHRSRIVEDGYRQLASLSPQGMKGVIRYYLHYVSPSFPSTLITVHYRSWIVEDGYRQLASLSPQGMKGVIRYMLVPAPPLHLPRSSLYTTGARMRRMATGNWLASHPRA
jgi:hypothetical protein